MNWAKAAPAEAPSGDLLYGGLEELDIEAACTARLIKYIEEIELFNSAYGLVKAKDRRELIVKHILDSLAPLGTIRRLLEENPNLTEESCRIADVGSGAGLPGIPLSVCLPKVEFTLIERMGRRAGFLRDCVAVLGLNNVRVEECEMEKAMPGRFDAAVFRAFKPLEPAVLKGLFRLLKPGAFLAAWKGRFQIAQEEMLAAEKSFPGLDWEIIPINVPFLEEERRLAVLNISG